MNHDELIEAFVAHINAAPREPFSEYALPFTKSVHVGDALDGAFGFGYWDWNIKPPAAVTTQFVSTPIIARPKMNILSFASTMKAF